MSIERKIAFSQIKGLQIEQARGIIERLGSIDAFFDSSARKLWEQIGCQRSFCTEASREALLEIGHREKEFCDGFNATPLFMTDDEFPQRLLECCDGPSLVFRLGDCNLNARHVVSIVGTRQATPYGQRFTADLVASLAEKLDDLLIVSGLAYGIDVAAHRAALNAGVPTAAVVAHGLTTIYPAAHRDVAARMVKNGGALITEYTSKAPIHQGNFLARNRIVAGLADVTVVVESDRKGGSMVTASIASAYNREVCAVPGRANDRYSAGPLKLIATNRAALIRNADDLIALMNWETKAIVPEKADDMPPKVDETIDPEKSRIIDFLRANERATVNEMVVALGMSYAQLSARLMEMEMDDMVNVLPGSAYSLNV